MGTYPSLIAIRNISMFLIITQHGNISLNGIEWNEISTMDNFGSVIKSYLKAIFAFTNGG